MKLLLLRSVIGLLSLFSISTARSLGSAIGGLMYRMNTRMVAAARVNLALCLPDKNQHQRELLVKRCMQETGKNITEAGISWSWPLTKTSKLITQVHNEQLFDKALQAEKGVVLTILHHGNWEIMNHYLYRKNVPFSALYKPPKGKGLDRWVTKNREKTGLSLFPTGRAGAEALNRTIEKGGVVIFAPDQTPGSKSGVFAPFFGIQALTGTFTQRLLQQNSEATALCTCVLRTQQGFEVYFKEMDQEIYNSDPLKSAAALNRSIEPLILMQTEQYQWGYKRFKKRPDGDSKLY